MNDSLICFFKSKVKLNIKGKNVERFIKRLIKNKIELLKVEYIKYNEINIIIYKENLEKIEELKTIYEVSLTKKYGLFKLKEILKINKYFLFFTLIGLIILYGLSNIIFEVEIIHTDKKFRNFIKTTLEEYGIKKNNIIKNYDQIQNIKEDILNKYNDQIEWIEIERSGTKYIIKVEERIMNKKEKTNKLRHIVAKKNGIIIDVDAKRGDIIKNTNDYVHKGDIIISGNLYLNETYKSTVSAEGDVYAEVWYKVKTKYPYKYKEIKKTGNEKTVYTIKFLDKYFDFFNFKKYKTKNYKDSIIIKNNLLPFSLIKQQQIETIVIDENYNKEQAEKKALELSLNKIKQKLNKNEEILNYKIINKNINKDNIEITVFVSVKENITDYALIKELPKEEKTN